MLWGGLLGEPDRRHRAIVEKIYAGIRHCMLDD